MAGSGYVITTMVDNTAGYTLVGVKDSGGSLSSMASSTASGGYIVNALDSGTAGYTLVGIR